MFAMMKPAEAVQDIINDFIDVKTHLVLRWV